MQQAQDFLEESEALYALVAPLADSEFDQKTDFKDWTLSNVFRHLHIWNRAADMSLNDEKAFLEFYEELGKHIAAGGTLMEFEKNWLNGISGQALIILWRDFYLKMAQRFAEADPSSRVKWAGPDMSVRSSITARLMETWAHGQEVYDLLGVERKDTDRIRNIVVLGVNTYGWTYKVRGEQAPSLKPCLKLVAPSGELWTYGEPDDNEIIEGRATEFCQVVTQVRNVADTKLKVTGRNATDWMSKAQCFAGGSQAPPAPGTRKLKN